MTNRGIRLVPLALLAVYVAAGAAIVLWPKPVDSGLKTQLATFIASIHAHGVPSYVNYAFIESGSNVIMFMPLGFLVTLMLARKFSWVGPVLGLLLSTSAELAQYFFLPDRFATVEDVIANTSGAMLGTLIAITGRAIVFSAGSLIADAQLSRPVIALANTRTSESSLAA